MEDKGNFAYLAIVSIVAIVSLVVLMIGKGPAQSYFLSTSESVVRDDLIGKLTEVEEQFLAETDYCDTEEGRNDPEACWHWDGWDPDEDEGATEEGLCECESHHYWMEGDPEPNERKHQYWMPGFWTSSFSWSCETRFGCEMEEMICDSTASQYSDNPYGYEGWCECNWYEGWGCY
ncbi:hypothetical protein JW968_06645 [Candidatus Woesearchaeota archaeon]|nr:hypothetical protein [Candidatus Woesearchaeota archaeon]